MVLSLTALGEPVGSVKQWLPATTGLAGATVPQNWLICDGSTVADSSSAYNGIALPDTRQKFKRGHNSLTNSNFASDNTYKAGGTIPSGGTDTNNIGHSHGLGGHVHSGPNHTHGVSTDGGHIHNSDNSVTFGHNLVAGSTATFTDNQGAHSHGGATGAAGTGSTGGPNTGSDSALGLTENRPAFLEFVTIIKIK